LAVVLVTTTKLTLDFRSFPCGALAESTMSRQSASAGGQMAMGLVLVLALAVSPLGVIGE